LKATIITALYLVLTPLYIFASSTVVGYYPAWLRQQLPAEKIAIENLTHVIHAFAWPEEDGSISHYSNLLYPQLNQKIHSNDKKILVSLGGWGQSEAFSSMTANQTARNNFIENVIDFCVNHDYDGADIDWEHPSNSTDRNRMLLLMRELRQAFNERDSTLLLTMAVPAGSWSGQWYDYLAMKKYVNWFGCMTYDIHGNWSGHSGHNSPLYAPPHDHCGSVHTGIEYLTISRKIPKEKILLGIPFYGKEFNASGLYQPFAGNVADHTYHDIVLNFVNGWLYQWDEFSKVPYLMNITNTKVITYDDSMSVRLKCEYALDNNLAGVMIWALGQDVCEDNQPLLETVGQTMSVSSNVSLNPIDTAETFILSHNYPNPFSQRTTIKYRFKKSGNITVDIFDISGRKVNTLYHGFRKAGEYQIVYKAENLPPGVYFYRIRGNDFSQINKMILVKTK